MTNLLLEWSMKYDCLLWGHSKESRPFILRRWLAVVCEELKSRLRSYSCFAIQYSRNIKNQEEYLNNPVPFGEVLHVPLRRNSVGFQLERT